MSPCDRTFTRIWISAVCADVYIAHSTTRYSLGTWVSGHKKLFHIVSVGILSACRQQRFGLPVRVDNIETRDRESFPFVWVCTTVFRNIHSFHSEHNAVGGRSLLRIEWMLWNYMWIFFANFVDCLKLLLSRKMVNNFEFSWRNKKLNTLQSN